MRKTRIEWTETTWNPIRGCSKVSPGCAHCYAERMAARFAGRGQPYEGLVDVRGRWTGNVRVLPDKIEAPLRWTKPRLVFVNSMSDLFHEEIDDETILAIFKTMQTARMHTYQILTKRADRMLEWFNEVWMESGLAFGLRALPPHIWVGVTAEDQEHVNMRVPLLVAAPVSTRFVSVEPIVGEVNLSLWLSNPYVYPGGAPDELLYSTRENPDGTVAANLDWVIAGCESGPHRRRAHVDWFRMLRDQCVDAGVPFFLKQADLGEGLVKMPSLDGQTWAQRPEGATYNG